MGSTRPTHLPGPGNPVLESVSLRQMCRQLDQREAQRLPEACDLGAVESP